MPASPPTVRTLRSGDFDWPAAFDRVSPRPEQVYLIGALPQRAAVALVGSRQADAYGMELARGLAAKLAEAGVAVISGGALGIDGAAHAGALAAGGATVAVLGCGVDVAYPPQHGRLLEEIGRRGGLLSELSPGTPPLQFHFPRRNRLIAALADVVVVVRAAAQSGSLSTARAAAKLGVPVLAVPGPAGDALSRGTNGLLRKGAGICEGVEDILNALETRVSLSPALSLCEGEGVDERADAEQETLAPGRGGVTSLREARAWLRRGQGEGEEPNSPDALLLALLSAVPTPADVLGRAAHLPAAEASAALTRLELAGLVARRPGNLFHVLIR